MRRSRQVPNWWDTDWLVLRGLARLLERQIARHVARGSSLIDLGCGDMPYREFISHCGIRYIGADIGTHAEVSIDAEGRVPLPDASVDAALSVQVLEHVRDLNSYFSEIRRLLKSDGTLLLSTHGAWLYHPHPEDHRRWTREGLVSELGAHGFNVHSVDAIVGPLATTTLIRPTGFAYLLRKLPIIGGLIAALLAVVMNLRALLEDKLTPYAIRRDNAGVYLVRAGLAAS